MANLCCLSNRVVIGSKGKLKVFSTDDGACLFSHIHEFDKAIIDGNNKPLDQRLEDLCSSSDEKYICAIYSDKTLVIVSAQSWTVVKEIKVRRRPTAMTFEPEGKFLLVADKSGDLYQYEVEAEILSQSGEMLKKECQEMELHPILGHVSMLLDVKVTSNRRYIVTTDRDEKIRVSELENPYVIESFCLGHTEFVCKIQPVPRADKSLVLSTSGDGTVRLWDVATGKEHNKCNFSGEEPHRGTAEVNETNRSSVDLEVKGRVVPSILACNSSGTFFAVASNQQNMVSFSVFTLDMEKLCFDHCSSFTIPGHKRIADMHFGVDTNTLYALAVAKDNNQFTLAAYECKSDVCIPVADSMIFDDVNSSLCEFEVPEDLGSWDSLFKARCEGEAYTSYHKKKEERLALKCKGQDENDSAAKREKLER